MCSDQRKGGESVRLDRGQRPVYQGHRIQDKYFKNQLCVYILPMNDWKWNYKAILSTIA